MIPVKFQIVLRVYSGEYKAVHFVARNGNSQNPYPDGLVHEIIPEAAFGSPVAFVNSASLILTNEAAAKINEHIKLARQKANEQHPYNRRVRQETERELLIQQIEARERRLNNIPISPRERLINRRPRKDHGRVRDLKI